MGYVLVMGMATILSLAIVAITTFSWNVVAQQFGFPLTTFWATYCAYALLLIVVVYGGECKGSRVRPGGTAVSTRRFHRRSRSSTLLRATKYGPKRYRRLQLRVGGMSRRSHRHAVRVRTWASPVGV